MPDSAAPQKPLSPIDRLFMRLSATWGNAFLRQYDGMSVEDIKAVWEAELGGFLSSKKHMEMIAWALANLPERPMNVIEFRNLCRRAPTPKFEQLPAPKADPQRVAEALAKLGGIVGKKPSPSNGGDHRAWAKGIIARHEGGERVNPTALQFARQALRMA